MPVTGKFFWVLFTLITSVCVHIAYILFGPEYVMANKFSAIEELDGTRFKVVNGADLKGLIQSRDPGIVMAVCAFDVSKHPYLISIPAWKTYWSLTIYSSKGNVFYSIHDRQVSAGTLVVKLEQKTGDDAVVEQGTSEAETLVNTPSKKGLAVLRARADGDAEAAGWAHAFSRAECKRNIKE